LGKDGPDEPEFREQPAKAMTLAAHIVEVK
jgi:hypothetical protein